LLFIYDCHYCDCFWSDRFADQWDLLYTAAPSLNLTAEEKRVFGQLFRQADTDGLGVVTGEVAVKFFEKTRLEPRVLGEVRYICLVSL
jgi:hypothetical protein